MLHHSYVMMKYFILSCIHHHHVFSQYEHYKPSIKYGISPENIEDKALNSERFKTLFNMHIIEKTSKLAARMDKYDKKRYQKKKKEKS